jgi:hypothetical protein
MSSGNNLAMHYLRNAKNLARFMLVWFALSIGVAVASPMVQPQGMQLVCSGGGAMKIIVAGDDSSAPTSSHTLDCPLCASIGAPPPLDFVGFVPSIFPSTIATSFAADAPPFALTAPPPARGPPALA